MESEQQTKPHILIIDDSKVVRWQADKLLREDYLIHLAENGRLAWDFLQSNPLIALAFCDLQMPEMDGFQLLEKIRSSEDLRLVNLPVVILTGDSDDKDIKHRCLASGATDFIAKPFDEVILQGRAAAYTGYQTRLSKLEHQVEHDPVTGLANIQHFRKFGQQGVTMALRHQTELTLILADIDNHETLLQQLGKKGFGQLLAHTGKHISPHTREEDLISLVGQARYGVILPLTNAIGASRAAERILDSVKTLRLKFAGNRLQLTFSIGVASLKLNEKSCFSELAKQAKEAMKQAQSYGGDRVVKFEYMSPEPTADDHVAHAKNDTTSLPSTTDVRATESLEDLVLQTQTDGIARPRLRGLMLQLWPLLKYADKHLDLGLGEALNRAKQRLSNEERF